MHNNSYSQMSRSSALANKVGATPQRRNDLSSYLTCRQTSASSATELAFTNSLFTSNKHGLFTRVRVCPNGLQYMPKINNNHNNN